MILKSNNNWHLVVICFALLQSMSACQSGSKEGAGQSKKSSVSTADSIEAIDDVDENNALSSSPRDESDSTKNIQDNSSETKNQNGGAIETAPQSLSQKLQEALKEQNDSHIMKASADILAGYPHDILALNSMAMSHYRQNRMRMAKYFLNKAIKQNAQYSELHSNLGLVFLAENEKKSAIQSFRRALQVNPKDPVASANLGALYTVEKDYIKAGLLLETAYKAGFKDSKTLTNYGVSLVAQEKYSQALNAYQSALEQQQQSQETILNLAILQIIHLKKMREGQDLLNRLKFVEIKPEWRSLIKDLEKRTQMSLE
jgi:Flp pilus assembly protein TadD